MENLGPRHPRKPWNLHGNGPRHGNGSKTLPRLYHFRETCRRAARDVTSATSALRMERCGSPTRPTCDYPDLVAHDTPVAACKTSPWGSTRRARSPLVTCLSVFAELLVSSRRTGVLTACSVCKTALLLPVRSGSPPCSKVRRGAHSNERLDTR